jgi:hypothetical protein
MALVAGPMAALRLPFPGEENLPIRQFHQALLRRAGVPHPYTSSNPTHRTHPPSPPAGGVW